MYDKCFLKNFQIKPLFWPIISLDVKSSADEIKSSADDITSSSAENITLCADDITFSADAITFGADDQRCSTDVRQSHLFLAFRTCRRGA